MPDYVFKALRSGIAYSCKRTEGSNVGKRPFSKGAGIKAVFGSVCNILCSGNNIAGKPDACGKIVGASTGNITKRKVCAGKISGNGFVKSSVAAAGNNNIKVFSVFRGPVFGIAAFCGEHCKNVITGIAENRNDFLGIKRTKAHSGNGVYYQQKFFWHIIPSL